MPTLLQQGCKVLPSPTKMHALHVKRQRANKHDNHGVVDLSRRRSTDPTKAISITLPLSLLEQIDDQLTRTSSRSLWIATACKMRMDEDDTLGIETRRLMAMLRSRAIDDGDETLAVMLLDRLLMN